LLQPDSAPLKIPSQMGIFRFKNGFYFFDKPICEYTMNWTADVPARMARGTAEGQTKECNSQNRR
jgi:hypothetical protein